MSIGGHHSAAPKSQTWLTPPHIKRPLGRFDLDPCAAPGWPTADVHYILPQDGLALPWFGRVWLNPPYEKKVLPLWLQKLWQHGRGIALIFARTETDTFFRHVWDQAHALLFIRGRLHFHLPDGTEAEDNAGGPSVLIGYGVEELDVLADCQIPGQFVPLRFPRSWLLVPEESWTDLVTRLLRERSGPVALADIYSAVRRHPKAARNPNWRAKVRQSLARAGARKIARATYTT